YVEWTFAWDERMCSNIRIGAKPPSASDIVPKLLSENRDTDAWVAFRESVNGNPEGPISWIAKMWVDRALKDPATATTAAIALLKLNDRSGLPYVQAIVRRGAPESLAMVDLLLKSQVPICPLINENLTKTGAVQQTAME